MTQENQSLKVTVRCPHCGSQLNASRELLGQERPCVKCQRKFIISEYNPSLKVIVYCPHCGAKMSATQKMLGKEKPCPNCKKNFCVQEKKTTVTPPLNQPESERISSIPSTNKIVISFDDIVPASAHSDWVVVPSDVIPKQPNVKKLSPRQRRLNADFETVTKGLLKSRFIKIQRTEGTPPEVYYIEYNVRGIEAVRGGQIQYRNQHLLKIQLTSGYPREQPKCQLLTPIFHPNFEPAVICIGDHWTAQERLIDLVIRIGEMIAYQSYNIKSPLDGEAAMWADQHENLMPIDKTDLMPPE